MWEKGAFGGHSAENGGKSTVAATLESSTKVTTAMRTNTGKQRVLSRHDGRDTPLSAGEGLARDETRALRAYSEFNQISFRICGKAIIRATVPQEPGATSTVHNCYTCIPYYSSAGLWTTPKQEASSGLPRYARSSSGPVIREKKEALRSIRRKTNRQEGQTTDSTGRGAGAGTSQKLREGRTRCDEGRILRAPGAAPSEA